MCSRSRLALNPGAYTRTACPRIAKPSLERRMRAVSNLALLVLTSLLFPAIAPPQLKPIRRVLMLNDLGIIASPGFAEIDQAVFLSLQASPYQIELYHESLELTLFPDEDSQRRFREQFVQKYSNRTPDVIIAVGSESLKFIADSRKRFLRDTPVVFCAIIGGIPDQLKPGMHFTGVLGRLHPEETLNAALLLLPGTKHVVVVGGVGKFDQAFEAIAKQGFHSYESKLEFTYLTNLTMPSLLEQLTHLPSKTIIYHTAITRDAAGERFIDSAQSVPLVASAANAPVFVMDDVDLRGGTVGGDLVNWADDGRVAGEMAVRVLNGEKPEDIPIATSKNAYMFDWRALRRWGLKESNVPPGSIVINRQVSFWQQNKRYLISGFFVLFAQMIVILALLRQRAKRMKTEAKLVGSNERLRSAMEELRESQGRFEGIVTSAMDAIIAVDQAQRIVLFNPAAEKMFGSRSQDAIGSPIDRFIPQGLPGTPGVHTETFGAMGGVNRQLGETHDLWAVKANGEEFPIEFSAAQMEVGGKKLFTVIIRDVTERKLAEEALSSVSRRLIEAHEDERTWIARELHDDVNQRLAFVAVTLDVLKRELPASAAEAGRRISDVREQIKDLGNDVQALSHRLHSSKLEYLGLAAAAGAFCREFSERKNVEIDFQSDGIPRTLPQETSLCLFRVLQEALQNAAKHSGSTHYRVSLTASADQIHMTVSDQGVGFSPEQAMKGLGLGITSMRERLKLVKGELSIESQPGKGTVVRGSVPLGAAVKSAVAAKA